MAKKLYSKKFRFPCYKCEARFISDKQRNKHALIAHPLPVPEPEEHVNYIDLVRNSITSWGQSMTKKEKKHPSRDQLLLGALFLVCEKLDEVLVELRKTKTLK